MIHTKASSQLIASREYNSKEISIKNKGRYQFLIPPDGAPKPHLSTSWLIYILQGDAVYIVSKQHLK